MTRAILWGLVSGAATYLIFYGIAPTDVALTNAGLCAAAVFFHLLPGGEA